MGQESTNLQQQPLKSQAGVPARQVRVAECLSRGQAQLEHPTVPLQHPPTVPEQLHVGAQLLRGDTT